jgi:hypothetical protein
MASLKRFVQRHFPTIMLLLAAGGFALIAAELLLTNHTEGLQMVGLIASVIGLILGVVALFLSGQKARDIIAILFIVLSISGLLGMLQHAGARAGDAQSAAPPLASLSLSGLAFLAAAALLGVPQQRTADIRTAKPSGRKNARTAR